MKHLKLFESYYEDLTPYRYGLADKFLDDPEYTKKFEGVNIGWIGDLDNFQKGEVPAKFIDRLIEWKNRMILQLIVTGGHIDVDCVDLRWDPE